MTNRPRASANRRGVAAIAGGSAFAQVLGVAATPLLSRLYDPAAFGLLAVFTAIVSVVAVVAAGRLEMAIAVVPSEQEARDITAAGLALAVLTGVIGCLAAIPLSRVVSDALGLPALVDWLWLAAPAAGAAGAFLVLNQWAVRVAQFGTIAVRGTVRSLITVIAQVAGAVLGAGGLVVGFALGQAGGTIAMMRGSGLSFGLFASGFRLLPGVFRRFRSMSLRLSTSGLLNVLGTQSPVLIFSVYYSADQVGWLGLTQRTLTLPVGLIGMAVASVYLSVLSDASRAGRDVRRLFYRVTARLGAVAIVGSAVLILQGPQLFDLAFGERWRPAGEYARILAMGTALQLVAVPLGQTLIIAGKTGLQLAWDLARTLGVSGAVGAVVVSGGEASEALIAMVVAQILAYGSQWLLCRRAVENWSPTPLGDYGASEGRLD